MLSRLSAYFLLAAVTASAQPLIPFYLEADCDCHDEIHQAATYWNSQLLVTFREVPEKEKARVIFTRAPSSDRRVVTLTEDQIENTHWLQSIVAQRGLNLQSELEQGRRIYGENNLKPQKIELVPLPADAPEHIRRLRWQLEQSRRRFPG